MLKFAIGDRVEIYRYSTAPDPDIDPERKLVPEVGTVGTVRYSKHNRWIYGVEFEGFGVLEMYNIELGRAAQ